MERFWLFIEPFTGYFCNFAAYFKLCGTPGTDEFKVKKATETVRYTGGYDVKLIRKPTYSPSTTSSFSKVSTFKRVFQNLRFGVFPFLKTSIFDRLTVDGHI